MNKILTIAGKELSVYFKSPTAYILLVITMCVFNVFFFLIIDQNREATLRDVFLVMEFMFVFLAPLFTMRVFAEEKAAGTMEFLMTTPTSNTAIVLGKYLGSLTFLTLMTALSSVYYWIIEYFSRPDPLAVWTGYIGIWLEGALFTAVGILASSWTRSQVAAAMSSYLILFLLYFSVSFTKYIQGPWEAVIRYTATMTHAGNFIAGIVEVSDIVYYLSGIVVCLILTRASVENRLWR